MSRENSDGWLNHIFLISAAFLGVLIFGIFEKEKTRFKPRRQRKKEGDEVLGGESPRLGDDVLALRVETGRSFLENSPRSVRNTLSNPALFKKQFSILKSVSDTPR